MNQAHKSLRESGYSSASSDWSAFLACWRERRSATNESKEHAPGTPHADSDRGTTTAASLVRLLTKVEARIGLTLPPSFKDFQTATRGAGWYVEADGHDAVEHGAPESLYGLLRIGRLKDIDKGGASLWDSDFKRPPDDEYYRYGHGSGQLEWAFDGAHVKDMVKVGGLAQGALVLLNPHEITRDGELEAWVLSPQHGLVRYRSFAEMVREMAYRDIRQTGGFLVSAERLASVPCLTYLTIH